MPCPHNEITIVQRSQRQSAVDVYKRQVQRRLLGTEPASQNGRTIFTPIWWRNIPTWSVEKVPARQAGSISPPVCSSRRSIYPCLLYTSSSHTSSATFCSSACNFPQQNTPAITKINSSKIGSPHLLSSHFTSSIIDVYKRQAGCSIICGSCCLGCW